MGLGGQAGGGNLPKLGRRQAPFPQQACPRHRERRVQLVPVTRWPGGCLRGGCSGSHGGRPARQALQGAPARGPRGRESWEPLPLLYSRGNRIQAPPSPGPSARLCPLPSATPAGRPAMRAAGARRGGGTATAPNRARPHPPQTWPAAATALGHPRRALPFGCGDGGGGHSPPASLRLRGGRRRRQCPSSLARGREGTGAPRPALRPRTRLRSGPGGGRGRREAAAPSPTPPSGPARRSRQAPAPARRPGRAVPPPPGLLTRGAAVRTHLRSRPLPGHPPRRRGRSPLGQRGGRGRRPRAAAAAAALLPGPAPARPRLGSARPAHRPPRGWPGTRRARLPARPRAPSAPRRPAAARRSLSPPLARLPAAPAGSGAGPAHRGRGPPTRPLAAPPAERKPRARAGRGGGA